MLQQQVGLAMMPFSRNNLQAALNWAMKAFKKKGSKNNIKPFSSEQILAMLGFLVKGDDVELTKLHLASIIVLCRFASNSFEEARDLAFDSIVIQLSGGLLFNFPVRGNETQLVGRAVELRTGNFMGCQIDPVDILKRYLWHISALPLGPPSFLFSQFIGRVHPDGHRYQVVGRGNGDPVHSISISQVWQELLELRYQPDLAHYGLTGVKFGFQSLESNVSSTDSRRDLISSSYLSGDRTMVYWSAGPSFPRWAPMN